MGQLWKDDDELFAIARNELYSAVVGDIMDQVGLRSQFLPPWIQPLEREMAAVGRAMTVLEADLTDGVAPAKPFGMMLDALDDLRRNEIYLCTGGTPRYAQWGELMSTRARKCGATGAVLNGYSRDTRMIVQMGFPTFSRGSYAQDQAPRGQVVDFRIPIDIEGVHIEPGDIVFADLDGVCIVPKHAETEVFSKALEKARGEKTARNLLEEGMTAREVFEKYGIL